LTAANRGFSAVLTEDLLYQVNKPGQYLGNEWGAAQRDFDAAEVRLCLAFPDIYELGMSNFGQRILYQIVNKRPDFMCDRTYAPGSDLEEILRKRGLPLWGWESRRALTDFELIGFSLQYELTYTNVLNMLEMSSIPVRTDERTSVFPLTFGGGPSAVNPEPMAYFLDFFMIGDGEAAVPNIMDVVRGFKRDHDVEAVRGDAAASKALRRQLLIRLAKNVPGVYVPSLYDSPDGSYPVKPTVEGVPERVARQVMPLTADNQPAGGIVPYLALVHDRQVLEVRRGCDRGCRFCQPGYTFLPVRERTTDELVDLSKKALDTTGYQEYSLLSLCVSDYTSLHETVRALNREHSSRRASMSFPSQRADRMNFEIADELKAVRKSGITLAPEAGTERLRAVINKGLSHEQIINAITTAYQSGWSSVKLYYMNGLPTERDEDLIGIVDTLKEATDKCRAIRKANPEKYNRDIDFTCTLSNFVPKPFTPFQWFGQVRPAEFIRRHLFMREALKASRMRNVQLNFTGTNTSLLEAVISRGDRRVGELIFRAWKKGCTFDAWDDRLQFNLWVEAANDMGVNLEDLGCEDREVGSNQPWDVINVGLANWWLVNEWKKAMEVKETAPCSENTCHACGICTDLDVKHELANPPEVVLGKNPFVKKATPPVVPPVEEQHPSLAFQAPPEAPPNTTVTKLIFEFKKTGELRFIGHLDLQHLLIRAARRARIFVAYTEGFNPGPKLSLALSLALYSEGLAEVGEIELSESVSPDEFVNRMNAQLPRDVQLLRARAVDKAAKSVANVVGRATYRAVLKTKSADQLPLDGDTIQRKLTDILSRPTLEIETTPNTKGRHKHGSKGRDERKEPSKRDLRPGIYSLKVAGDSAATIELELAHGPKLHVKPSDVLKFVAEEGDWRITRVALATDNGTPLFDV
jgi:radical SAM family uncharacterized protein/radical SAM-linked protein